MGNPGVALGLAGLALQLAFVAVRLSVTAAHGVVLHGADPGARVLGLGTGTLV